MSPTDPATVAALVATAFVAGFVDAIAGGGGLLTVPALALAGLDPVSAIATNKVQSLSGAAASSITYWRAGHVERDGLRGIVAGSAVGAVFGALLLSRLPKGFADAALPVVLVAVAGYVLLAPGLRDASRARRRMSTGLFAATVAPIVGAYDGLFGPGTGAIYLSCLVGLLGLGVVRATGTTKVANFASNLGGFLALAASGAVVWQVGLPMAVGQVLGARLGARATIRGGAGLVRPMVILVCVALALKLAFGGPPAPPPAKAIDAAPATRL